MEELADSDAAQVADGARVRHSVGVPVRVDPVAQSGRGRGLFGEFAVCAGAD